MLGTRATNRSSLARRVARLFSTLRSDGFGAPLTTDAFANPMSGSSSEFTGTISRRSPRSSAGRDAMPRRERRSGGQLRTSRPLPAGGTTRGSAEPERENDSAPNTSSLGEVSRHICPGCGKRTLDRKYDPNPKDGGREVLLYCWICGNANAISKASGIPVQRLLARRLPSELGPPIDRRHAGPIRQPYPPPAQSQIDDYCSKLFRTPEALHYLITTRGLTQQIIEHFQLGLDSRANAVTIPVWGEDGELDNLRRRYLDPDAKPKIKGLPGRPSALYPDIPRGGALLLVAGEFDALIGRQIGLPTTSSTCGTALPDPLARQLARRRVFVMFDVSEELAAAKAAGALRVVGAEAIVVRLSLLGLPKGSDLNDFHLNGGTGEQIKALCRRERRSA